MRSTDTDLPSDSSKGSTRSSFVAGCTDSLPVCLSFVFLFFSIGAASRAAGFSAGQSVAMTALVHAAPMQAFMVQNVDQVGIASLLFATLIINFRFAILSSVLAGHFAHVSTWRLLLSIQLMSISTFTLTNNRTPQGGDLHGYFLGCGICTLAMALVATLAGVHVQGRELPFAPAVVEMILPVHFTAVAALCWPRSAPLAAMAAAAALTPLAAQALGRYHVFAVPLVVALAMLCCERLVKGRGQR